MRAGALLLACAMCAGCFQKPAAWEPGDGEVSPDATEHVACGPDQCPGRALAAGFAHTCLVRQETLWCWGDNAAGQLGTGTQVGSNVAVALGDAGTYRSVDAGPDFTCAATTAGQVRCFGSNGEGQLGDGGTDSRAAPDKPVPEVAAAVAVATGEAHACAVDGTGQVWCWGRNQHGQIGNGVFATGDNPQRPADETDGMDAAVSVDAGQNHTCALDADRHVWCWGANDKGQVGVGGDLQYGTAQWVVLAGEVTAMSAGANHTCALQADGQVRCWGDDWAGQVGSGALGNVTVPLVVKGLSGVTALSAGGAHTCAVAEGGQVWCWGRNDFGQLGDGTQEDRNAPVDTAVTSAVAVAAGERHTCALLAGGGVRCWGANGGGQLGDGLGGVRRGPVPVASLLQAADVAAGDRHACAVAGAEARVFCWGDNAGSQLGDPELLPRQEPVQVGDLQGLVQVTVGTYHSCARDAPGNTWCWGTNDYGQLGDGSFDSTAAPTPVGQGTALRFSHIDAGETHTCGIEDGTTTLWCWGDNQFRQAVPDDTESGSFPAPHEVVGDFSPVDAFSAGGQHTCVVSAGYVWCWGRNTFGQLGDGNPADNGVPPFNLPGISDADAVFAGSEHTYVRHASGSLTCWGANNLAQLGTGKDTSGPEPVPVKWPEATPPPGNPVLSLGAEHTCAFWPAGTPWCWGGNYYGQAGVGSDKNPIATPTALALPAATTALSQGTMFGCAAGDGGAAYCWGANDYGQMGDKGSWSLLPVTVQELD